MGPTALAEQRHNPVSPIVGSLTSSAVAVSPSFWPPTALAGTL